MSYYVLIDDEQVGPIERDDVADMVEQGSVRADTLAWTSGMTDWVAASQIPDLAGLFAASHVPTAPPPPQSAAGSEIPLDFERVFNTAFGAFRAQFGPAFLVSLLYNLVSSAILVLIFGMAVVAGVTADSEQADSQVMQFGLVGVLLMMVVMPVLYGGLSSAMLSLVRNEPVRPSQLLAGISRALPLIFFWLLYAIGCSIGMLFLLVPALMVAASFMLTPFVIMESRLGTIDAMKAGYRAAVSLGWWRCVFLLGALLFGIFIASIITETVVTALASPLATFVFTLLVNSIFTVILVACLAAAYEQARENRARQPVTESE